MNFPLGKALLGAAAALIALFFAVPIAVGGSMNICEDVALHNVNTTASSIAGNDSNDMYKVVNTVSQSGWMGDAAQQKQAHGQAHIPVAVSCASTFWQSL